MTDEFTLSFMLSKETMVMACFSSVSQIKIKLVPGQRILCHQCTIY